jgi:RNA polymerase sigma-70 factor (ECF subfamily)
MRSLRLVQERKVPDDDEIKELARVDREAGQDVLIRKYREPIFHHAAYILKDYEEAIDVAQEVFIKAMREERFFDDEFKMKAWLYRVTSNLCFNMVRDRRRRSTILDGMERSEAFDPHQVDVVSDTEQQASILDALEKLTDNHKRILMLRYYSDLSYTEIADALDIKLGTVMSRLSRAKRQLMEVLGDQRVVQS